VKSKKIKNKNSSNNNNKSIQKHHHHHHQHHHKQQHQNLKKTTQKTSRILKDCTQNHTQKKEKRWPITCLFSSSFLCFSFTFSKKISHHISPTRETRSKRGVPSFQHHRQLTSDPELKSWSQRCGPGTDMRPDSADISPSLCCVLKWWMS